MRSICQRFGLAERCGFQGRWYELPGNHQRFESESSVFWRSLYQFGRSSKRNARTFLFIYWNFYSIFVGSVSRAVLEPQVGA